MRFLAVLLAVTSVACGDFRGDAPVESTPSPTPSPTPPASVTTVVVPPPVSTVDPLPAPVDVVTTPATTALQLQAACSAAAVTLDPRYRYMNTQRFATNDELDAVLRGTKWYACTASSVLGADGIAFHSDRTTGALVFDGRAVLEEMDSKGWSLDSNPPNGYKGTTFFAGTERYYAVLSTNERAAVVGHPGESTESIYIRID